MDRTFAQTALQQALPRTWEFCRAISGLAAIVLLLGMVLRVPEITDAGVTPASSAGDGRPRTTESRMPPPGAAFTAPQAYRGTMAFYLVGTQRQADLAQAGEQIGATAYASGHPMQGREYVILYARDEGEEQAAAAAILEALAARQESVLVEIMDFRSVSVGDW